MHDGRSALQEVLDSPQPPDLVVLDLGLPDVDGVEVIRRLRGRTQIPVIVLSARHDSDDKVEALDAGADDFVTKPFGVEELLARIRVAERRLQPGEHRPAPLRTADVELDFAERTARRGGQDVHLTPTEWSMLDVLAERPGHLVSQQELLRRVWGVGYDRQSHYLRVYVSQLRRKLEDDPAAPRLLVTEPGQGYRLEATPPA
ncbi:response regulator [Barrientosiimonas humi]